MSTTPFCLKMILTATTVAFVTGAWAAEVPRRTLPVVASVAAVPTSAAAPNNATPAFNQQEIRAQLSPRRYTTLAAEIGAKVSNLPVAEGGAFKQGQLLIAFDCSIQKAQLHKAKASLVAAEKTWQTNKRLYELNSVGMLELETSQSEMEKNKAEVDTMSAVLAKCTVPAPFSGRVAEQKVREQQFVQPSQAILEIIDDSVLELELIVPSRWLAWLKVGHRMQVRIDETGREYPVKVKRLGATVDPVSQSVKLVAAIDGSFPELIAGMSGRVNVGSPTGK